MTGQTISHFKVLDKLGGGGMGVVYLAEDVELDRKVALKFLPTHLSTDQDANARFVLEAKAASALNHPNVCTIHEIGHTEEGQTFIAMAFYEGETLKKKLEAGALPIQKSADIARQVALGLAKAHEKGIVHRDIKPANIMVTDDGRTVILDFGLAKLAGTLGLTQPGSTVGTTHYMSPEQILGADIDQRTDIWSLGVMLYEMLAGQRPFEGEYEQAAFYAITNSDPIPLQHVSKDLEEIVTGCLTKDPAERTSDAKSLAEQLTPAALPPSSPSHELAAATATHSRTPWLAGGVLAIVALVAAFFFMRPDADGDLPTVRQGLAVLPFSVSGDPTLEYLSEGMVDLFSTALDGAGNIRTFDPYIVIGEVQRSGDDPHDPISARGMVERLGADSYILGSILRVGEQIRLAVSHYDASGNVIARADRELTAEAELLGAVEELAHEFVSAIVSGEDDGLLSLVASTTSSFDALKAYLRGEKALREGRFQDAQADMQLAVDADSTFALAWSRMGTAAEWVSGAGATQNRLFSRKAEELADRLPDRQRRLVKAKVAVYDGDIQSSLTIYRSLTREFHADARAWYELGDQMYHYGFLAGHSRVRAREPLERARSLDPSNAEILYHLIELARDERQFRTADSLIQLYPEERQRRLFDLKSKKAEAVDVHQQDSLLQLVIAEIPDRLEEVAAATRQRNRFGGTNSPSAADLEEGVRMGKMLVDRGETRFWRGTTQYRLVRTGSWDEVDPRLEEDLIYMAYLASSQIGALLDDKLVGIRDTFESNPGIFDFLSDTPFEGQEAVFRTYFMGLLAIRVADWSVVANHAATLRDQEQSIADPRYARGFATTLEAYLAWHDGDALRALDLASSVQTPREGWPIVTGRGPPLRLRATILMEQGRYAEALEVWESIAQTSLINLIPGYLIRAQCYEGIGDTDHALAFYQALVDMWKDADPELQPMVEEARAGVERLLAVKMREPA